MTRDFAGTAQAHHGVDSFFIRWLNVCWIAAGQVDLAMSRRYGGKPLLHAYLSGFGDAA